MDTTQLIVTTGLFGLLGAATTYRWLAQTGRLASHSPTGIGVRIVSGAMMAAGMWVLFNVGRASLPDRWARVAPYIVLIVLASASPWMTPRVTDAGRQSTRRIQTGIMIGGLILIAACLIVFS